MKTKERIFYYDLLRAFAIIAVLICHADHYFGLQSTPIETIFRITFHDIGRIGVPIFLMISGALLLNRDYELSDFLKRRFARIIYPFIFWIIIIIAQLCLMGKYKGIWTVFIGDPSITWYFWALIGIYLFLPVINSFIKEYGDTGLKYFLAIWFITIILQTFNAYPPFKTFDLNYFANYIGYPILGYYLDTKVFKMSDRKVSLRGFLILLVSLAVFVTLDVNGLIDLTYLNVPIVLMGLGLFLFIKYLNVDSINPAIKKIIVSLSVYSYGMYFSHTIIINIISRYNPHKNIFFPVMFGALIFLSWLSVFLVSKIPYLKKFSGA